MSEWTEEQRAAIALHGASVVVSAAAGSGKTTVLVERACRILSAPYEYPVEKMVIVTFANDAARELKTRLSARLREMAANDPKNPWLRRQRAMLAGMKISTIHSFCNDLLRGWGTKLGISPRFRVIEDEEEQLLRTQTAEEILEEAAHKAREDEAFAECYAALQSAFCKGADDTELRDRILDVYSAAMNRPFGLELFKERLGKEDAVRQAASALILVRLEDAEILDTCALEVINAFGDPKKTSVGNAQNILEEELRAIENMRRTLEGKEYRAFCRVLRQFSDGGEKFDPRLPEDFKSEEKSAKGMRNQAKETLDKLAKVWLKPFENAWTDLPRHTVLVQALFEMVEKFAERLNEKKREKEVIGFDDALQLTLELVAERDPRTGALHRTETAREISKQYDFLMIDEFQDADDKQDLIFRMLSYEGSEERFGNNLFVVGDSKQSIYAFRGANPKNFYRAMEQSTLYDLADAPDYLVRENTLVHLNRNFRSRGEIIDFVNAVFEPLMSRTVGEIDYDEHHRLVPGARYPEADCPVELLVLRFGGNAQGIAAPEQAEMIADRIAYHLNAQTPVTVGGKTRPCEPGDFLVVARNNGHLKEVAEALRRRKIAAVEDERKDLLDSEEVCWLLDCLRVIDNPRLDIPMAAVMLSPVMGFTLDEVVRLRLAGRKKPPWLFRVLAKVCSVNERAANPEEAEALREIRSDEALMGKCRDFVTFIKEMRLRAAMDTPEALIRRILAERDFEGLARAMDDGERRKANLRVLPGLAKNFSDNRGGGLSDFLRYIDRKRDSKSTQKSDTGTLSPGAVSLKTIHKSKGLEKPFVIPVFLNSSFNKQNSTFNKNSKEFLFNNEIGCGTCYYDKETLVRVEPLPHVAIAQKKLAAERSEEMRLLYVALTRARERLILPIVKYKSKSKSEELNSWCALAKSLGGDMTILARAANSMQDWLLQALLCNRGAEALREELDVSCHRFLDTEPVRVTVVPYEDPEEELFDEEFADETFSDDFPAEEAEEPAMVDEALLAKISAACSNTLPRVSLMAKYGVSELSKTEEFSVPLRRPVFSREHKRKGLTGAERGTALHTFLQFADFSRAREDIPAEAQRLCSMGRLSQKQMEACADANLEAFFESPLFARIARAQTVCRERKFTVRMCDLRLEGEYQKLAEDYAGTDGMLVGVVDLFFEEDGEIVLVDYKSDEAKDADTLRERYTEQLALYAAAIELIRGQKVKEKLIYSLKLCQAIPV